MEYIDPVVRKQGHEGIIEGTMKIYAGFLKVGQIKKGGVDVGTVKFTKRQKEAIVNGKFLSGYTGKWGESKDVSYWVYKRGKWYVGDEKEVKKEFAKEKK